MKSSLRCTLSIFVLVAVLCSPVLVQGAEVSADRAYGHVENLVKISPRFAGTEAEATAASYIENEFKSYDLEAWVENFTIDNSYVMEENLLRVTSPEQINLEFIPVVYSPSIDNIDNGQLVQVTGEVENLEQLRGRVVLAERSINVGGKNYLRTLADASPLAVLTYFSDWPPYSEIWLDPPGAPILWVPASSAQQLIEWLGEGEVEVEIQLKVRSENATSSNVLALLPGQSEEIVVVGAHHDSMLTPGAVDDASGVAVVLELARTLSTENLPRTILFATFGSEELGLLGSAEFMREHDENKIVAAIIFDSIAAGPDNGLRAGLMDSGKYATTEWLDNFIQELAENLGFYSKSEHLNAVGSYSDHVSFTGAGVPATWIFWANPSGDKVIWPIHTLGDNMDAISKTRLYNTITFGLELTRRLAVEDLEALRQPHAYEVPLVLAAFATLITGVVVLSVATSSYLHYRKGWSWSQAARVLSIVTALMIVLIYLLLLP